MRALLSQWGSSNVRASKPTGDSPQTQTCSSNAAESEGDQSKISDTKQNRKKQKSTPLHLRQAAKLKPCLKQESLRENQMYLMKRTLYIQDSTDMDDNETWLKMCNINFLIQIERLLLQIERLLLLVHH